MTVIRVRKVIFLKLGSVVKARRIELNMSQRDLAKAIDASNSTISRIESDDGIIPTNDTLRKLSKNLSLDYNWLLALAGQIEDSPEIRQLYRMAKFMSKDQKKRMVEIFKQSFPEAFENIVDDRGNAI